MLALVRLGPQPKPHDPIRDSQSHFRSVHWWDRPGASIPGGKYAYFLSVWTPWGLHSIATATHTERLSQEEGILSAKSLS